jgi:hypothetical protein
MNLSSTRLPALAGYLEQIRIPAISTRMIYFKSGRNLEVGHGGTVGVVMMSSY